MSAGYWTHTKCRAHELSPTYTKTIKSFTSNQFQIWDAILTSRKLFESRFCKTQPTLQRRCRKIDQKVLVRTFLASPSEINFRIAQFNLVFSESKWELGWAILKSISNRVTKKDLNNSLLRYGPYLKKRILSYSLIQAKINVLCISGSYDVYFPGLLCRRLNPSLLPIYWAFQPVPIEPSAHKTEEIYTEKLAQPEHAISNRIEKKNRNKFVKFHRRKNLCHFFKKSKWMNTKTRF